MKKFIRYLYEYQNGQRVQNVGFVKVEHSDDCEVIQIYGKGFPIAGNQELEVLVFYMMGKIPVGISMGKIKSTRPMFGYRLEYTPEDVGGREIYNTIDGIILLNDINGFRKWYAAVWDEKSVPVEQMVRREELLRRMPEEPAEAEADSAEPEESVELEADSAEAEEPAEVEADSAEAEEPAEVESDSAEAEEPAEMETDSAEAEEPAEVEADSTEAEESAEVEADSAETEEPAEMEADSAEAEEPVEAEESAAPEFTQIFKITRKDIAKLPRKEWRLANNNFLLHGYYNYHHLVSFEKDNCCWLGVPGIYHPKEQRAADSFGFGQFMKPDAGEIDLSEEEMCVDEDFGYWCRKVSAVIR